MTNSWWETRLNIQLLLTWSWNVSRIHIEFFYFNLYISLECNSSQTYTPISHFIRYTLLKPFELTQFFVTQIQQVAGNTPQRFWSIFLLLAWQVWSSAAEGSACCAFKRALLHTLVVIWVTVFILLWHKQAIFTQQISVHWIFLFSSVNLTDGCAGKSQQMSSFWNTQTKVTEITRVNVVISDVLLLLLLLFPRGSFVVIHLPLLLSCCHWEEIIVL